jgi:hypothetical protein
LFTGYDTPAGDLLGEFLGKTSCDWFETDFLKPVLCVYPAGKSGGGPPQSKTLPRASTTNEERWSVLECSSPLELCGATQTLPIARVRSAGIAGNLRRVFARTDSNPTNAPLAQLNTCRELYAY